MDIRVLKYFLEVIDKGSLAKAADSLHTTAPNISRQISDLEIDLNTKLFKKDGRKLELTEDGLFLKARAKEILSLAERTEEDIKDRNENISGNIFIGAAETHAMHEIAKIISEITTEYPSITFHIQSGDSDLVSNGLDSGIFDFGLLSEPADIRKYSHIKLPISEEWGLLMHKDHPLASLPSIRPEDLIGVPLMCSYEMKRGNGLFGWAGKKAEQFHFVVIYNLINTPAMLAESGVGCVFTFKSLINTNGTNLCFRYLNPKLESALYLVWKQDTRFSKAAQLFLDQFQSLFSNTNLR